MSIIARIVIPGSGHHPPLHAGCGVTGIAQRGNNRQAGEKIALAGNGDTWLQPRQQRRPAGFALQHLRVLSMGVRKNGAGGE